MSGSDATGGATHGHARRGGFEVLDVHHHVGNAFRALGGAVESAPELSAEAYARKEIESRLEIMAAGGVHTGHSRFMAMREVPFHSKP